MWRLGVQSYRLPPVSVYTDWLDINGSLEFPKAGPNLDQQPWTQPQEKFNRGERGDLKTPKQNPSKSAYMEDHHI